MPAPAEARPSSYLALVEHCTWPHWCQPLLQKFGKQVAGARYDDFGPDPGYDAESTYADPPSWMCDLHEWRAECVHAVARAASIRKSQPAENDYGNDTGLSHCSCKGTPSLFAAIKMQLADRFGTMTMDGSSYQNVALLTDTGHDYCNPSHDLIPIRGMLNTIHCCASLMCLQRQRLSRRAYRCTCRRRTTKSTTGRPSGAKR